MDAKQRELQSFRGYDGVGLFTHKHLAERKRDESSCTRRRSRLSQLTTATTSLYSHHQVGRERTGHRLLRPRRTTNHEARTVLQSFLTFCRGSGNSQFDFLDDISAFDSGQRTAASVIFSECHLQCKVGHCEGGNPIPQFHERSQSLLSPALYVPNWSRNRMMLLDYLSKGLHVL